MIHPVEMTLRGRMSTFGGPDDTGVSPSENLALVNSDADLSVVQAYFLNQQPPGTTGLARRLNPATYYIACRWNYADTPKEFLIRTTVAVTNPANGRMMHAKPIDWGPSASTGRIADLSPGLATVLGLQTDDIITVEVPMSQQIRTASDFSAAVDGEATAAVAAAETTGPSDLIPVPPRSDINSGRTSASETTMRTLLGIPGELTPDCSDPSAQLSRRLLYSQNVGPFVVSGLDFAVASLRSVFTDVHSSRPDLYSQGKTAGMLCVRARRTDPGTFSNHSWGTAIDVYFGTGVAPQGQPFTQRGVSDLYYFFHQHGWYWGAGFSGSSVDSMHFELADETIRRMIGGMQG